MANISRWAWRCTDCGRFRPAPKNRCAGKKDCVCGCTECIQVETTPNSWNEPTFIKQPIIKWNITSSKQD